MSISEFAYESICDWSIITVGSLSSLRKLLYEASSTANSNSFLCSTALTANAGIELKQRIRQSVNEIIFIYLFFIFWFLHCSDFFDTNQEIHLKQLSLYLIARRL